MRLCPGSASLARNLLPNAEMACASCKNAIGSELADHHAPKPGVEVEAF